MPASDEMQSMAPDPARLSGNAERLIASANGGAVSPAKTEPVIERKLIYTGTLHLQVPNLGSARQKIEELIAREQGYLVQASLNEIQFRIPPKRFKPVLAELSAMGNVIEQQVNVQDVTDKYFDLELRQQVAEQSRQRLMALLDKSTDTKAVLEIERDIRRLTEELEEMKGALRLLGTQIEMATLTVNLIENAPPAHPASSFSPSSEFYWLNAIGFADAMDARRGAVDGGSLGGWLAMKLGGGSFALGGGSDPRWLPAGFALLRYDGQSLVGTTPHGHKLRVQRAEVNDSVDLAYWTEAVRTELGERRGYILLTDEATSLTQSGLTGHHFAFESSHAATPLHYDLWIVQKHDRGELLVIDSARELPTAERRAEDDAQSPIIAAAVHDLRLD